MHLRSTAAAETVTSHSWMRGAWGIWGLAASFYLIALFHRMSLGVASLDAQQRFGLSAGSIATLSALQLGLYLIMTIPAGLAADRIGPRRALTIGLVAMAIGETAFGLATSAPIALGGRALVGAGDAFMFLSVLRIAQNWFPAHRYALLASLTGLAGAIGQIGTTVPLGLSLDGMGWTATFVTSGVITGVLALACLRGVRDRPAAARSLGSDDIPVHDGIAATLRLAWARPATRHAFWAHFGLMGPFVAITALWGYPYLVQSQGLGTSTARAWLLLCVVSFGAGAPIIGALVSHRPSRRAPLLLGVALTLTTLWGATLLWPGGRPAHALILVTLLATGTAGAAAMPAFDLAREGNPAHRGGSVTGLVNTGGFTCAVAVQLAVGWLLQTGAGDGLQTALLALLAMMLLACVQIARLARRARPPRRDRYALPSATIATPAASTATPST